MRIEFNTTAYQMSHGRHPRGTGAWAFFFNREMNGEPFWVSCMPYGAAKSVARAEATRQGAATVYVGP
jgi:hypothetical protein